MDHESIADIPEHDLVDRLLRDSYWQTAILNISGIPAEPLVRSRLPLRDLAGQGNGDVDILAWSATSPSTATAIEVKRIKVSARSIATGQPNKLQEYEKASQQANRLSRTGFWQVYLFVIVVVDSRSLNPETGGYVGAPVGIERLIDDTITLRYLDQRVGVVKHEIIQSMNYQPLNAGSGGAHLVRLAGPSAQPPALTEWVARIS